MTYVTRPDTMATIINEISNRVLSLETNIGLNNSAINGGALSVYDSAGVLRAQLGLLPNGDYGLYIKDSAGNTEEVLPLVSVYAGVTLSTTSTTYVALTGSPSVTAVIGASGNAKVTVSAYVTAGSNATSLVGLVVDGGTANDVISLGNSSSGSLSMNLQTSRLMSSFTGSLTPGSHTFSLKYRSSSVSSSATFGAVYIEVQPL